MKTKQKIIPLVISAVIFLAGCITAIIGASMDKKKFSTEWSCVYNLDEFTFDICLDRDYETKHSFTRENFR